MLRPKNRNVSIVIERDELLAPPNEHWESGSETDGDRGAQTLGPQSRGSQRRLVPIKRTHAFAHLAAAGEEIWLSFRCELCSVHGRWHHGLFSSRPRLRPGPSPVS